MATRSFGTGTWRLRAGESVLSAARAIDTSLVQARLERFERAHRDYSEAQRQVDTAESQLREADAHLADVDAVQDKALGALAGALIAEGQPVVNAFAAFGAPPLGALTRLPFAEEAQAVHELVATVERDENLGKGTIQAAHAADKAARAVEEALVPVEEMQKGVREARRMRDVRAQAWDSALASLKHDARAAARDGTPQLYAALFPSSRPATKSKAAAVNAPPVPDTPSAPTASTTETSTAA